MEEILISSISATSYQNNTPWCENVLHKKHPLNSFEIQQEGMSGIQYF